MKDLFDYKETIHKCSKCGLCQSVCPNYLETGNECTVSRGLFIMLQGIIKGDLKPNKTIEKYLDACLKCGKCSEFCPSGIDIVQVLLAAKHEFFKRTIKGKILSFMQSKLIFNTLLNLLGGKKKNKPFKSEKKVVYFAGCIDKINPKTTSFAKEILNRIGYEVLEINFNCCGLPFLTSGNLERFEEQMQENLKKIEGLEFEYFVTDCASCQWAWMEYANYGGNINNIKFKSLYDLIIENNLQFVSKKHKKITYHKACHEKTTSAEEIIKNIENCTYIEMNDKDGCCGFANMTNLKQTPIQKKKKQNIKSTKTKHILTTCVGCVLSINYLLKTNSAKRVIEFLQKECFIK